MRESRASELGTKTTAGDRKLPTGEQLQCHSRTLDSYTTGLIPIEFRNSPSRCLCHRVTAKALSPDASRDWFESRQELTRSRPPGHGGGTAQPTGPGESQDGAGEPGTGTRSHHAGMHTVMTNIRCDLL